ncbi:MAG: hypothetical protein ABID71_07560 [Chloroflexota bacterium]
MIPLPKTPTDTIKLCDWLEIGALLADDSSASSGDLKAVLRRAGIYDAGGENALDLKVLDVFHEFEQRETAAGGFYPFKLRGGLLTVDNWPSRVPYVFCLCLSYFGWKNKIGNVTYPRRLFEDLSCDAAKNYLHGKAVRFASPRVSLPKGFQKAVSALCISHLREGEGCRIRPLLSAKDDTIDVVAWQDFPDGFPNKLLLFGGCASGNNWEGKINDCQPDAFCEDWMIIKPVSQLIKTFFIPHRIDKDIWFKHSRRCGIIFDRCRIAYWVADGNTPGSVWNKNSSYEWSKQMIESHR